MNRRTLRNLASLALLWATIALATMTPINSGQGQGGTFGHNPPNNGSSEVRPRMGLDH